MMTKTGIPKKPPKSKAVEDYEIVCKDIRTNVSSDVTISWISSIPTWAGSSSSTTPGNKPPLVDLSEQLRRRFNMSIGKEYRCLYCNNFVTRLESQYPHHVFTKHRGYLPYAKPDDLKSAKAGRRTVGKKKKGGSYNEWRHTQESIIHCIMMQAAKQKWWRQQLPIQQAHQLPMIRKALDCAGIRVRIITESNI
jgi:hypothetical protein